MTTTAITPRRATVKGALAAAATILLTACTAGAVQQAVTPPEGLHYRVDRVIDGDTIEVLLPDGTSTQRVRLIGVDTPETTKGKHDCYGAEATAFVQETLTGADVLLQPDPTQSDTDRYGRLLRYVQYQGGGAGQWKDLGRVLLEQGYAREYTYDAKHPAQQRPEYLAAQAQAQQQPAGLWAVCS